MITKIISGGQTGVDRAALDVAIALDIPHGGWCPKGRLAEDGIIARKYALKETLSDNPLVRTQKNVLAADASLIFCCSIKDIYHDGTGATIDFCKKYLKEYFLYIATTLETNKHCLAWLLKNQQVNIVNIAGPRKSNWPEAYLYTTKHLTNIMETYFSQ